MTSSKNSVKNSVFKNKVVLITGGTGSFGKAFAQYLLRENACAKVIIFSRDEWKQWEMRQSHCLFDHPKIRYFLGDVRDIERLRRALHEVHYVIHAAALKQVPAAEYNPDEFIKTNVMGAMNVTHAALDARVEKVIALSTDKSVNPINLYGATKLCSDKLFLAASSYTGKKGHPLFSIVRYGNVLGSRGSIIPFWRKLIAQGERTLPITDKRMTRFWITLEQAVAFVKNSLSTMQGGEIFIPKIPSMRIVDLAQAICPGIQTYVSGIRPGEKLHELLLSADESRYGFEETDRYIIQPHLACSQSKNKQHVLPHDFCYASDTNPDFLTPSRLKKLLSSVDKASA